MTQGMFEIKVGSKYLIRTSEDDDTIGIFEGYAMLGSESAVVIRMEGDRLRFVPTSQISFMDLLESAAEPEKKEEPEHLYG